MKMMIKAAILSLLLTTSAQAADIHEWFKSLRNTDGIVCCDVADGNLVDYKLEENKYWVYIENKWYSVPDGHVLIEKNIVGKAIVWYNKWVDDEGLERMEIRCFLPGPLG